VPSIRPFSLDQLQGNAYIFWSHAISLLEGTRLVSGMPSTPCNQTFFQEEVTPASIRPPNRRRDAHRTIAVLFNRPSRGALKQTQEQHIATSTRTFHRHTPRNALIRDQINRIVSWAFWR